MRNEAALPAPLPPEAPPTSDENTNWHRLLERINEEALLNVGLSVYCEFHLTSEPLRVDILVRRTEPEWTKEQLARLPDGMGQSTASHLLWCFKKSESFNEKTLFQALCYDATYKRIQRLSHAVVETFLLVSKTPRRATLAEFEYEPTPYAGVYKSQNRAFRYVTLIILNDLSDEPHNMFVKCFASREKERQKAFDTFSQFDSGAFTTKLRWFMLGLWKEYSESKGDQTIMRTPEEILESGRKWATQLIKDLPPQEYLSHHKPEEVLPYYKPQERLAGLNPEEVLPHFKPQERLAGLSASEIKAYLKQLESEEAVNRVSEN